MFALPYIQLYVSVKVIDFSVHLKMNFNRFYQFVQIGLLVHTVQLVFTSEQQIVFFTLIKSRYQLINQKKKVIFSLVQLLTV